MPDRQNDAAATERLHQLFESEFGQLRRFAERYVRSPDVAADVVQEVFVRVWERRGTMPIEDVGVGYLVAAVKNEALNRQRRHVSRQEKLRAVQGLASPPTPADTFEYRRLQRDVDAAVDSLPQRCREVFLLVRRDGLSYAEAADALGLSVKTIETQMGRALKHLRDRLHGWLR